MDLAWDYPGQGECLLLLLLLYSSILVSQLYIIIIYIGGQQLYTYIYVEHIIIYIGGMLYGASGLLL